MASKVPTLMITERDAVMYEMKKSGASYRQIAKQFEVSESTAYRGVERMQVRIRDRMGLDLAAEARMDVDRMEDMFRSFWPLTKAQRITPPGSDEEVVIPPSTDAAKMCMDIIKQRAKFIGYDSGESLSINVTNGSGAPTTEAKDSKSSETTPEQEVKDLLKVFQEAGIMNGDAVTAIQEMLGTEDDIDTIVDAEVVEEEDEFTLLAIDPAKRVKPTDEPPEIVDDYDEEFPDSGDPYA